ncbi:MAG: YHYH protein [Spirosomataceae bacterium]
MKKYIFWLSIVLFWHSAWSHPGEHGNHHEITFKIKNKSVRGNFLMSRNDSVFIQQANGNIISAPLSDFSFESRTNLTNKIAHLKQINSLQKPSEPTSRFPITTGLILLLAICGLVIVCWLRFSLIKPIILGSSTLLIVVIACKKDEVSTNSSTSLGLAKTDPLFLQTIFSPFKDLVKTRNDNTYFYIESNGLPSHNMMVGITSWQQQVPLPQDYTGTNAWAIPLQPEFATSPISLKTNLMKGAVAIAPNGVPIFNPLNNRGEDAFAIGELDNWGGHCGRADDYHYHIAPLHFETTAGNNPIAIALDGFPVYGTKEPDGSTVQALDEYHGHTYKGGYHYHASSTYPYFIAAMRGKVTLDPTTTAPENQIIPQAKATPIRPAGEPLKGASITAFKNTGVNSYSLEYLLNNQKGYVNYNYDNLGNYTFTFITPDGKTSTTKYVKK